ncbi:hypothetical protein L6R53_07425 [Myxococcota bacterium]|nr:hypothetical protein [Myxococcota bacterium]
MSASRGRRDLVAGIAATIGVGLAAAACLGAWPWALPSRPEVLLGRDLPEDGAHTVFLYAAVADGLRAGSTHLDGYWHPFGRPLLDGAWNVVDAVVAAPLLGAVGPYRGTLLATSLFGLLNALSGGFMGWRVGGPGWPMVVGSVGLAFAPFAWGEVHQGRPTQSLLAAVALVVAAAWAPGRGLAAGAATALAGWVYWFQGLFASLIAGLLVATGQAPRRAAPALLVAAVTCAVLVAPFAVLVADRWGELQGSAARRAFPVPVALPWQVPLSAGDRVDGRYLPLGLLALALLALGGGARLRAAALWAGAAALSLLALGEEVVIDGQRWLLPWRWLSELPLLSRLWWPYRALGAATVALAAAAALGAATRPGRWLAGPACLAVAGQCLLVPGRPPAERVPPPAGWEQALPAGPVLVLPAFEARSSRLTLLQQPRHGRPLVNGMGMAQRDLWPPEFTAWWRADPLLTGIEDIEGGRLPTAAASPQGLRAAGVVAVVADRAWWAGLPPAHRSWLERGLGSPDCGLPGSACAWVLGEASR